MARATSVSGDDAAEDVAPSQAQFRIMTVAILLQADFNAPEELRQRLESAIDGTDGALSIYDMRLYDAKIQRGRDPIG